MTKKLSDGSLNISAKTWLKDTNGLFDYSSKEIIYSNELIKESQNIIREGNMLKSDLKENTKENNEKILTIEKKEKNKYYLGNNIEYNMEPNSENIDKVNNYLWYVINDNQKVNDDNINKDINRNYYLMPNDIIKLGRLKFCLIEDSFYSGDKKFELTIPNLDSTININNSKSDPVFNLIKEVQCLNEVNPEEKIFCRICYSEEEDKENNPMVHLCNCKGGINYAHYNCIKLWMRTKLIRFIGDKKNVMTYYIPRFNCEICKAPYPYRFKLPGKEHIYELIDIHRPSCNYIILESLDQIKENNNNKYIHVVKIIDENDITIGRGIDADIKINDISVSRLHTKLKFNFSNKSLLIKDMKSKFGTLVLIRSSFELKEKEHLITQIGRTLVKAEVNQREKEKIFGLKKVKKYRNKKSNKIEIKNRFIFDVLKKDIKNKEIKEDIKEDLEKSLININKEMKNEINNDSIDMEMDLIN